jgi:hypothetical protein
MTAIDALRAALDGEVIGPEDAGFELERRTFNARVDARPAAIAYCASREDVVSAVAASRGLPVAVRAGGTSDASTVDGGVVIDVSAIDAIEVDAPARVARVGGGVTWGELDAATQEHGLAVTGGRLSRMGVAGVALGEGSGWLERALGPTGESVIGVDAVEVDGLRVVTRLDLRLHPVGPELLCGFLSFPRARAADVARAYRDYIARAPAAVGGGLLLGAGLGGVCSIVFCHPGTIAEGEAAVAPLRALGPSLDAIAPNPYVAFQRIWDAGHPAGVRAHVASAVLAELPDECLDVVLERANLPAASLSYAFLRPLAAGWGYHCVGLWPPVPALDRGQLAWVDGAAAALAPFT